MAYYLISSVMCLLHWVPKRIVTLIGHGLGSILFYLVPRRRKIGITNLTLCFPHMSLSAKNQLLKRHFQYLATAFLEYSYLWFSSAKSLKRWIRVEGYEHFVAVKDKTVILFTPHFVGLDMGGLRYSMSHPNSSAVYSRPNGQKGLSHLMVKGRLRFTQPLLLARQDGIRPIVRALRNKKNLYYLPDQDFGAKDSLFVPFFGIPAATTDALSRLAQVSGAAIVPVVTKREKNGYVLRYYPAWEDFPSDDVYKDTCRMNTFIEERIREMPEQYFWLHRRFKTRPPGDEGFYSQ